MNLSKNVSPMVSFLLLSKLFLALIHKSCSLLLHYKLLVFIFFVPYNIFCLHYFCILRNLDYNWIRLECRCSLLFLLNLLFENLLLMFHAIFFTNTIYWHNCVIAKLDHPIFIFKVIKNLILTLVIFLVLL